MTLSAGTRIGRYEIRSQLGAGGMGEVYLAFDTELDRNVALKILPSQLATDLQRMRRFVQEAKAASSLNHQNIITIYEIGDIDSTRYIATEFVEGFTLRQRMRQSPLSISEVFEVAIQIASALAAAHEAGIIHRDIKPENIMMRSRDSFVKVLDFGLVKLTERTASITDTEAPTRALVNTDAGTVMGTVAYMSPEQARGKTVDQRTDIWSLGVILYEMLTGKTPFSGETSADVIASIMKTDPLPITRYAPDVPEKLVDVVDKALEKDCDDRYQTIKDLLADLRRLKKRFDFEHEMERSVSPDSDAAPVVRSEASTITQTGGRTLSLDSARPTSSAEFLVSEIKRHKTGILLISIVAIALLATSGFLIWKWFAAPAQPASTAAMKITRLTSGGKVGNATIDGSTSISPDGKYVVFTLAEGGKIGLWVRQVSTSSDVQIAAPAEGNSVGTTISPDGEYVYHVWRNSNDRIRTLYQVPILGGTQRKILSGVDTPIGISPDGKRFAFVRFDSDQGAASLMIANIDGTGEQVLATRKGNDWFGEAGPSWSPDGKTIACPGGTDTGGTYMTVFGVPVDGGPQKPLTSHKWRGLVHRVIWLNDGGGLVTLATEHLQEGVGSQLWYISMPDGAVRRITNDLNGYGRVSLGLSADNRTIVTSMSDTSTQILVNKFGAPDNQAKRISQGKTDGLSGISWTPDGRIIYVTQVGENSAIWIMNADGSESRQIFGDNNAKGRPTMSPDGNLIFFHYTLNNRTHIWRINSDGNGLKQMTDGDFADVSPTCSPDGRWVIFLSWRDGNQHLWKLPVDGGDAVRLTDKWSSPASFSPDGKFVAYWQFDNKRWSPTINATDGSIPQKILEAHPNRTTDIIEWGPNGSSLIYGIRTGVIENLVIQSIDGGKPQELTKFPSESFYSFEISPDGKQLAMTRGTGVLDIVLIKDFK